MKHGFMAGLCLLLGLLLSGCATALLTGTADPGETSPGRSRTSN
ncbi:MAG: hypothetical protein ABIR48_01855 [Gammaproteobacteria bacterium]